MTGLRGERHTALVTGASKGIVADVARALGDMDFDLIFVSQTAEALERLAAGMRRSGQQVVTLAIDANAPAYEDQLKDLVEETLGVWTCWSTASVPAPQVA
jgi:short-subunit dehydrogenase